MVYLMRRERNRQGELRNKTQRFAVQPPPLVDVCEGMVATPTTSARASPRQLASSTPTDPALLLVSGAKQPSRHSPLARSFSQFSYMPEPYERVEKTRREMATRRSHGRSRDRSGSSTHRGQHGSAEGDRGAQGPARSGLR